MRGLGSGLESWPRDCDANRQRRSPTRSPQPAAQDHITLEDYEIHDGMGLELFYN